MGIVVEASQLTIRRENASMTNAASTNARRRHVREVGYPQGIGPRRNDRALHQIAGRGVVGLETAVIARQPRTTPRSPSCRKSRATVHRATTIASRCSAFQTVCTPKTRQFARHTRVTPSHRMASRFACKGIRSGFVSRSFGTCQ